MSICSLPIYGPINRRATVLGQSLSETMTILKNKKLFIPSAITLGTILILGLLWYYQSQGILKIFPTREDRETKRILEIDRSKFIAAQGLTTEQFEAEIKTLEERQQKVLENPQDAQAWFEFGYSKEFLNDHEGAVLAWEKSFALQPLNFVTAANLANTYQYFLKNYERSEFYYRKTLEIRSGYTPAYQGLSDLYRFNWQEKSDLFEPLMFEAIKNDPENANAYTANLVDFFARKNDIAKAREYLALLLEASPGLANELIETYPALK